MTIHYLILRCHPRDTLPIPMNYPELSLYVPLTHILTRVGPSRKRTVVPIPILPSFIFLPLPTYTTFSSQLNKTFPLEPLPPLLRSRLHLMRRPHGPPAHPSVFSQQNPLPPELTRLPPHSYATCTGDELNSLTLPSPPNLSTTPRLGSRVEITDGLFCGVQGIVTLIKNNGDISLKIQRHLGWQFSTCIVKQSVLCCV